MCVFPLFQAQKKCVSAVQYGCVCNRLQSSVLPRLWLLLRFPGFWISSRSHRQVKHNKLNVINIKLQKFIRFFPNFFRYIFSCCKMHDWCYDRADCPMFLEYFTPYVWTCYNNKPLCCKYLIIQFKTIPTAMLITYLLFDTTYHNLERILLGI